MEPTIVLLVDLGQNLAFVPLSIAKVEVLTPWVVSTVLANLTFALVQEKWVVLDQI